MHYLASVERDHPGTLLNNCSYPLWYERYVKKDMDRHAKDGTVPIPLRGQLPVEGPKQKQTRNHVSDWTIRVPLEDRHVVLFGCTEDVACGDAARAKVHEAELQQKPWCRTLCPRCTVPICTLCTKGLPGCTRDPGPGIPSRGTRGASPESSNTLDRRRVGNGA